MKCSILQTLLFFILIVPFFFISCTDPPVGVITKPSIKITNPLMNSNIPDSTTISVEINNISNIIRVELYINHNFITSFSEPPYQYFWRTYYYDDGSQFIIEAKAYDDKGNTYTPAPSIVNVYRFMPSGLQANLINSSTIVLNWYDNSKYETGFEVEQASSDSVFKIIATLDSNTTTDTIKGNFLKDQTYLFRVRAIAKNSKSGYSNTAKAMVILKPPEITNLVYNSDTTATINWKDNNDFESGFTINGFINGTYLFNISVPANTQSGKITGEFLNGNYYTFSVSANGSYYNVESERKNYQFIFNPPANLTATGVDAGTVKLSWSNSTSFSTPVKIERRDTNSAYTEVGRVNPGVTSFTDYNLDTSKTYFYRVSAFTRLNNISSNEIKTIFMPQLTNVRQTKIPPYKFASFDISRDGSKIVLGAYLNVGLAALLVDANTGNIIQTCYPRDSMGLMDHIGISYDNSVIGGGGYAKRINLWNSNDGSIKGFLNLSYDAAGLLFHPSKNIAVTFTDSYNTIGCCDR